MEWNLLTGQYKSIQTIDLNLKSRDMNTRVAVSFTDEF